MPLGMLGDCALRQGKAHSANGWKDVLDPVRCGAA